MAFQQRGLAREEPFLERGRDVAFLEVGVVEDATVERDGGLDAIPHTQFSTFSPDTRRNSLALLVTRRTPRLSA